MYILQGQRVSDGLAIGPCIVLTTHEIKVREAFVPAEKVEAEVRRFERALSRTRADICDLRDQQDEEMTDVRRIVELSLNFLEDEYLTESIKERIRDTKQTAPFAVSEVLAQIVEHLQAVDNPTFSSKVADFQDLEHRLLNHLLGGRLTQVQELRRPVIVVGEDLTPTQAATLDREKVLGFATERGSWASHTAILARAQGIPAVVGVPQVAKLVTVESKVIVDGGTGTIIVDPDDETIDKYRKRRRRDRRRVRQRLKARKLKSQTRDGELCLLQGNIETNKDVPRIEEFGGEGVGLFRTEFIFLGVEEPPDEDAQFEEYVAALRGMEKSVLTIRTMDVGGDKFERGHEELELNPFLGERAIRVSFKREEMFRTQLRAILRAGVHGNVRLMFPMIMDVSEFNQACAILDMAKKELRDRGTKFQEDIEVGTMVELPSTAINSRFLADVVDFFCIGTNDLTQYTLGVDRTNHRVSHLFTPHHPAVLTLISEVMHAARKSRKHVSICGEMAADPMYIPLLLGLGLRTFSVAPPQIPEVKRVIRGVYLSRCIKLAESALEVGGPEDVLELLQDFRS